MKNNAKSWLQLYVDATTERDPYKRLALVRELRQIPKHDESEESIERALEGRGLAKAPHPSRNLQQSSKRKMARPRLSSRKRER
jgi:hypothetical protein